MKKFEQIQEDYLKILDWETYAAICNRFYTSKARSLENFPRNLLAIATFNRRGTENFRASTQNYLLPESQDSLLPLVGSERVEITTRPDSINNFSWLVSLLANYSLAVDLRSPIKKVLIGRIRLSIGDNPSNVYVYLEEEIDPSIERNVLAFYCQNLILRDLYPKQKLKKIDWDTAAVIAKQQN